MLLRAKDVRVEYEPKQYIVQPKKCASILGITGLALVNEWWFVLSMNRIRSA